MRFALCKINNYSALLEHRTEASAAPIIGPKQSAEHPLLREHAPKSET